MTAYALPGDVAAELVELEGQITAPAAVAAFATDRGSCACGELAFLGAEETVPDSLDPRFTHSATACLIKDPAEEEADELAAWAEFLETIPEGGYDAPAARYLLEVLTELPTRLVLEAAAKAVDR